MEKSVSGSGAEGYCGRCKKQYEGAHGLRVHRYLVHTAAGRAQQARPRAKRKLDLPQTVRVATPLPNRKSETAAPHPNFCPRCGEALTDEGRRTQRALGMLKGAS